jgi:hypothetical protein
MKTFYSILSINIKPEINERLSIGMIMIYGDKVFFQYSKNKLSVIQHLIPSETYKAALDYLKLIKNSVASKSRLDKSVNELNIKPDNKYDRIFSEQYLQYLSRYNNNLISFTNTNYLDIEGSEDVFNSLFVKLIYESVYEKPETKLKRIDSFKKGYYPRVKPYFNIERKIDSTDFSGLLTPVKIDLMGKNEIEVFAQSIDFDKEIRSIEFNVGNLLQINRAIPTAKQFVLGFEPGKQNKIHHRVWNNIRKNADFDYVDISESDKIEEYAKSHGVTPLFD